jgi:hypothetical protein
MKKNNGAIWISFLVILMTHCSNPGTVSDRDHFDEGIVLLKISFTPNSPFSRIAHTSLLTVSAPDMLPITASLTITDTSVQGTVKNIPSGKNRHFDVFVYDSAEVLQYRGSALADVVTDSTIRVSISIFRQGGNALINGTIIDSIVSQDTPIVLTKNPSTVALWNFNQINDSTVPDESGNNNNGFIFGKTTLLSQSWGSGVQISAGGGMKVLDATKLRLSKFEIVARVFPTQLGLYNNIVVKEPPGGTTPGGYILRFDDYGYISGYVRDAGEWTAVRTANPVPTRRWYLIRLAKTDTGFSLYVNNQLVDSKKTALDPGGEIGNLGVGYDVNLAEDRTFRGFIDAIRIDDLSL